jgi:hypothetical protein
MEMAKHFGLVPSSMRNIILMKHKIKEAGMKCEKKPEKCEGWGQ